MNKYLIINSDDITKQEELCILEAENTQDALYIYVLNMGIKEDIFIEWLYGTFDSKFNDDNEDKETIEGYFKNKEYEDIFLKYIDKINELFIKEGGGISIPDSRLEKICNDTLTSEVKTYIYINDWTTSINIINIDDIITI